MQFIRIAAATALVFANVSSFAANLGTLDLSSGSNYFGNTPVSGAFSDFLTFTLPTAGTLNGGITTVVNGSKNVNFTSIALTPGPFAFTQLLADPVEVWASPPAGFYLGAGTYTLTLVGTNTASPGTYAGNLAVTLVPEPEKYAMLLAGLGVVALLLRRRGP